VGIHVTKLATIMYAEFCMYEKPGSK